jgi:PKD repeat protein
LYKDENYQSPIDPGANLLRIKFVGTANFTADVTSGPRPLTVQFTDLSNAPNPSGWLWEFGDGDFSTQQNPTHTYTLDGIYDVRLTVTAPAGLVVVQRNAYIRVGNVYRFAMISGGDPPVGADAAVADFLRGEGYDVVVYDDEPANRPTAAQLAQQYDLVIVSSTIASGNVAGEFRTVNVPLLFWENALLRSAREAMMDNGAVVPGTAVEIINVTHPITQGLAPGNLTVLSAAANMSVGRGNLASGATALARLAGSASDATILAAEAGAQLLGGYIAPARRVFLFFEDSSFQNSNAAGQDLLRRAVRWAANVQISCPADLNGDGVIDLNDLATLLANYGTPSGATPQDGDLDLDEDVDLSDLSLLLSEFGDICR